MTTFVLGLLFALFLPSLSQARVPVNFAELGFSRVRTVSPKLYIAQPEANAVAVIEESAQAHKDGVSVLVFPELNLVGYSLEDYVFKQDVLDGTRKAIQKIMEASAKQFPGTLVFVGAPYRTLDGRLYNCAFAIFNGQIVGVVPKSYIVNYGEFYENRWFTSGLGLDKDVRDPLLGSFKLSTQQLFRLGEMVVGVEICEDAWAVKPPSLDLALAGANVIVNLSASNNLVGKSAFRRNLVNDLSSREIAAYAYVSSNASESTRDIVYGGHSMIAESGSILAEKSEITRETVRVTADVDINRLQIDRSVNKTFGGANADKEYHLHELGLEPRPLKELLNPMVNPAPFMPPPHMRNERFSEILEIQVAGLMQRMLASNSKSAVIGVSGGADSTWALIVTIEAFRRLGLPPEKIIALTMPGFGTSAQTKSQALDLMRLTGVTSKTISIHDAVAQHFKDIDHDPRDFSVVFENGQARERTQILFDYANKADVQGIVIGTGDLSELCLGFCTYNADQMSSYGVNMSVPKTLLKELIKWYAESRTEGSAELKDVLLRIYNTIVSPELTPPGEDGKIAQSSEQILGPYEVHDFFIHKFLRNHFSARKIVILAELAFAGKYQPDDILRWWNVFATRFRTTRFKTTPTPAGMKVGSVSISPRDTRYPDDIMVAPPELLKHVSQSCRMLLGVN